ncbi:FtsK/SpoIIIE domain-containing protein [Turicibacter sanguinis]|uniref:FtsK/SpoIIIE domain-containing protein n=1 Tax=Turicibacter sanguinis TaxID=154288 RepID=UPI0023308813|nr:FtsK/SpoIIIE domain-containing protein [Turicibacter sanguinis]MDB8545801.1 FtsK/SpoIIIE domain-containing protein [Turicibacter sanguinis]
MVWWVPWALGGILLVGSQFIENKGDSKKELDELLNEKGYVKFQDKKNGVFGVELNNGSSFKDLENLKGSIENTLKSEVEVSNDNFNYFIRKKERKVIPSNIPFKLIDTSSEKGFRIAIGVGGDGIIYLDFAKVPHTLIGGATGWGKSIFTKNIIIQIINNFPSSEFDLLDFKSGIELGDFKDLRQVKSFTIIPDEAEVVLSRIYTEIEDRFAIITGTNSRDWVAFNTKSKEKINPRFVIIEEFTILLDQSKEVSKVLTKCLAIGRAVGVFFIFTSQRFDAKIIDPRIKANIDNRICFHTADSTNSKVILDTTGAETIKTVGRCLFSQNGEVIECQAFNIKENDVINAIQSHLKAHREEVDKKKTTNSYKNKKAAEGLKSGNNEGVILWE